jgi:hypothetical protein
VLDTLIQLKSLGLYCPSIEIPGTLGEIFGRVLLIKSKVFAIQGNHNALFTMDANRRPDINVKVNCTHDSISTLLIDAGLDCGSIMGFRSSYKLDICFRHQVSFANVKILAVAPKRKKRERKLL